MNEDDKYDRPIDLSLDGYEGIKTEDGYIYCPYIPVFFTTREERIEFYKRMERECGGMVYTADLESAACNGLEGSNPSTPT